MFTEVHIHTHTHTHTQWEVFTSLQHLTFTESFNMSSISISTWIQEVGALQPLSQTAGQRQLINNSPACHAY